MNKEDVNEWIKSFKERCKKLYSSNKNDLDYLLRNLKENISNLKPCLLLKEKELNDGSSIDLISFFIKIYLREHTKLSESLIDKDVTIDYDAESNQSILKIDLLSLTSSMMTDNIQDSEISYFINLAKKGLENKLGNINYQELLKSVVNRIDNALTQENLMSNITVFQNELNVEEKALNQVMLILNTITSCLAGQKQTPVTLWNDGTQSAINIDTLNLAQTIILSDIKNVKEVRSDRKSTKSQDSNLPPVINIPDGNSNNKNDDRKMQGMFFWDDEDENSKVACPLCSEFKKATERPKKIQDDIVITKNNKYQYRISYRIDNSIATVLSEPINYCPKCGRKLD